MPVAHRPQFDSGQLFGNMLDLYQAFGPEARQRQRDADLAWHDAQEREAAWHDERMQTQKVMRKNARLGVKAGKVKLKDAQRASEQVSALQDLRSSVPSEIPGDRDYVTGVLNDPNSDPVARSEAYRRLYEMDDKRYEFVTTPFHNLAPQHQQFMQAEALRKQVPLEALVAQHNERARSFADPAAAPAGLVLDAATVDPVSGRQQYSYKVQEYNLPEPFPTAREVMTDDGRRTGVYRIGNTYRDLPDPTGSVEGKDLLQGEVDELKALEQASADLAGIEAIFDEMGDDAGGPFWGRLQTWAGPFQAWNPAGATPAQLAKLSQAVDGAVPNLARGVFGEKGVLTDEDRKVYKQQFPTYYDLQSVRDAKLKRLQDQLIQARQRTLQNLKSAGRNVDTFLGSEPSVSPIEGPQNSGRTRDTAIRVDALPQPGEYDPGTYLEDAYGNVRLVQPDGTLAPVSPSPTLPNPTTPAPRPTPPRGAPYAPRFQGRNR